MTHCIPQEDPQAAPRGQGPLVPRQSHFILDRWQVLSVVKAVAKRLNIGEREITVLTAHLSLLAAGPVRSDRLILSWARLPTLLERANCMDERRFRRGEARLEEVGLIRRKLSGNARRYPVRDGKGQVVDAYGIDLRPLFECLPALQAIQAEQAAYDAARNALRSRISALVSEARRACADAVPEWLTALAADVRTVTRRAAVTLTELRALAAQVADRLDAGTGGEPDERPAPAPVEVSADAGQIDRHSESPRKEIKKSGYDAAESLPALWLQCPTMAEFDATPPRDETDLSQRLYHFGAYLGLSEPTRKRLGNGLEPRRLALFLEDMASRILTIGNPEGYALQTLRHGAHPL